MPAKPLTVLVVDDEMDMRMIVRLVLEASGRDIRIVGEAVDGIEALEEFLALEPPVIPDVVILDNRMPGRTGLEVAREMLAITDAQHIILYSAHLNPDIIAEARAIGIDRCVSKEVVSQLADIVFETVDGGAKSG